MTDLMYNNESLKIPGVPWPDWNWTEEVPNTAPVTHGIVEGTNIGYIYVSLHTWRFQAGNLSPDSDQRFSQAVAELWNTDGLIIDLRHDHGGELRQTSKAPSARCSI
jgi:C-terminal processing protease CtpA/Prc